MNKRVLAPEQEYGYDYLGLIACGALFICGCIVGTISAGHAADNAGLSEYILDSLPQAGQTSGYLPILFNTCKYHLAAVFFGFSVLGVFCLPALSAVRGFFLCFSVSAVVRNFGGDGVVLSLMLFGVGGLITVPCFFIVSAQSFSASLRILGSVTSGGGRGVLTAYWGRFFRRLCVCFSVLAGAALIDMLLISRLADYAAERLIL